MNVGNAWGYEESEGRSGLRGTDFENLAAEQTYQSGLGMQTFANKLLRPGFAGKFGEKSLPSGQYGLGAGADRGVFQFGRDMFSQASASGAMRGQQTPQNMNAVIGSAITNALPHLIPQMQNFQLAQFKAPQDLMKTASLASDFWSKVAGAKTDSLGLRQEGRFGIGSGG